MQTSEARRSQRVHYRAPVELRTSEGLVDYACVLGEATDLGAGGMRVSSCAHVPVGSHVTCRVELDGREATLPGRVAWLVHGEAGNGMGICFDPLGSYENALLQHAVDRSRDGYRSVELHFAGMPSPVRARGRANSSGLRISAALPIIARGAELSFRLDEEGPQFRGRVSEASLHEDEGARRIDVDVEVLDGDGVRFRRHARYGYPLTIEAEQLREAAPANAEKVRAPAARFARIRSYAMRTTALMLAATSGALIGWSAASVPVSRAVSRFDPSDEHDLAASTLPERAATRLPAATSPPAAPIPSAEPAPPEPPPPSPASEPEPAPVQAVRRGVDLRVEGDATRVLLPFDGTLEQMHARLWASPSALAIDLPNGRTELAEGVHPLRSGSAADLRIQRLENGTELIRIRLVTPLTRYAVTAQDGTLELRLISQPAIARGP